MWGADMLRAAGRVAEAELDALHEYDLTESDLIGKDKHPAMGSRRPLRVPLINPDLSGGVDRHGPYIRIAFDLSRGSFATVVLREIMKYHTDEPVNDNDE
jgi:tRNA pseudouridine13 synthase